MASNKKYVFNPTYQNPGFANDLTTEYPSHQITAKIRLNPSNIPDASLQIISKELRNKNMELSRSSSGNVITVSGTPPDNAFDRHKVLEIVQTYVRGAQFER